jgi:hypothetical protein
MWLLSAQPPGAHDLPLPMEDKPVPISKFYALLLACAGLAGALPAAVAQDQPQADNILRPRVNTLYGPSGLITVPNAYVATQGQIVLGTLFGRDKSASANYGVIRALEVGAAYLDRSEGDDKVLANAKVNFVPGNFKHVELGLGIADAFDDLDQSFYVVASGEWVRPDFLTKRGGSLGLRVHAGYGSGLFNGTFIGGAELLFNRRFSLLGEYNGHTVNGAVRYIHDQALRMQAGVMRSRLFFDASYGFRF